MYDQRPAVVHIVDDDDAVRDSMQALLECYGMSVRVYGSAVQFLLEKLVRPGDCLLLDLHMPGMNGFELLETLQAEGSSLPVVAMTGRGDSALRERAVQFGVVMLLDKPVGEDLLLQALTRALSLAGKFPSAN